MHSIPVNAIPFEASARLALPHAAGRLHAGFPSPAADFADRRLDLNDLLITHPAATFFWTVRGFSMTGAGIHDGDVLVINRALQPMHGDVVVAQVDNDFTVKYLHTRGRTTLRAANPAFPDIVLRDGQELNICGVVTAAIKRFR